jgi:malonate transporter
MHIAALLLPDFSLILLGIILYRAHKWPDAFWVGMEKMVYYLLFPALLFQATARLNLNMPGTGTFIQVGVASLCIGIALTWVGKLFITASPMTYESGMQTAFRFNSYMALALASRLSGEEGLGLMALLIGIGVPLCNMAAVHALAHKQGNLLRQLIKNPMLVSTVLGLLFSALEIPLPEVVHATLGRLGNASIALGLMLVGAGLRLSGIHENKGMVAYLTAIKLIAIPTVAFLLGQWVGLPHLQWQIVVLFCALPTASSAYVLATQMGGNGPMTAFLISFGTVLSILTIPIWLSLTGV